MTRREIIVELSRLQAQALATAGRQSREHRALVEAITLIAAQEKRDAEVAAYHAEMQRLRSGL